jgi:uncharacterized protein YjeT (DUF2065 family)
MSWIGPVFIALVGLLCMIWPKLFTNAKGVQFESARAKLRNGGAGLFVVGTLLGFLDWLQGG